MLLLWVRLSCRPCCVSFGPWDPYPSVVGTERNLAQIQKWNPLFEAKEGIPSTTPRHDTTRHDTADTATSWILVRLNVRAPDETLFGRGGFKNQMFGD